MARRKRATVREAADQAREALLLHARKIDLKDDRLGDLALYDLTDGFRCSAKKATTVFASHGLDPKHVLPMPPDWPVAFGRALESVGVRIRAKDYRLMDAAKGEDGERRVAIVQVQRNGMVTTQDRGTVVCPTSKNGGKPFVERADRLGFAKAVVEAAEQLHEVYTLDDIRSAIVQHIDRWFGLPLRRKPPYIAYWVPAAGGDEIRKLRAAVEELGAGEIELLTGYRSDPESKRTIVNTVNKGLEAQLSEFKAQVKVYTDKAPSSTRPQTIEDMIAEAKNLRERGQLYRDILGQAVSSVEAEYKAVEKTLAKHLGLVEEAHPEP